MMILERCLLILALSLPYFILGFWIGWKKRDTLREILGHFICLSRNSQDQKPNPIHPIADSTRDTSTPNKTVEGISTWRIAASPISVTAFMTSQATIFIAHMRHLLSCSRRCGSRLIESTRHRLYPLGNLVRRAMKYMRDKYREYEREVWLVALVTLVALLVQSPVYVLNLELPRWAYGLCGVAIFAVILILLLYVSRRIRTIDDKKAADDTARETKSKEDMRVMIQKVIEERDAKLIEVIQEQTKAIVAALQANSETIIKAMREPVDAHE